MLALFWRVLFRGQVCGWDCLDEYWPDLVFQSRALGDGELPLWNPYTLGGYAFYADPQAGVVTPVNWVCTLVSWVFGVGSYLIQLKVLLLFYCALVGMHVLVWRWTRNHAAAAIAALTFVAGSPMLVHKNSALIWPLLLLPWAMVALDAFRERATIRRGIALGFTVGMVAVSHPQGAFYSALIVAAYASYHVVTWLVVRYRARRQLPLRAAVLADLRRLAPGLGCAALIAGMWIATVVLPTWSIVDSSARAGRTVGWALSDPLTTRALRELFVPGLDTNWMHDIYLGPLAVIATVWLAIVRRDGRLWLAIAIASVLLALGAYGHLLPWLVKHVPGFGLFRIAYRYKLITGFAAAAATGLGIAALARPELSRRHKLVLAGAVAIWVIGALAITHAVPPWPAIVTVVALCGFAFQPRLSRWLQAAAVVAVLIDVWRAGDTKLAIMQARPQVDRGSELLAQMPGIDRTWRFHANRYSGSGGNLPIPYHAAAVHGVREISGFEQPLVSQRMLDILAAAQKTPALLTHFNTKYFIGVAPADAPRIPGTLIAVAADVAPIARLYPRAEIFSAPQILARLAQLAPAALDAALLEAAEPGLPAETFRPVDGRVVEFERSRLVIEIDAPAAGVLVINEAWSPLWRATIDGRDAALFPANYVLRGLVVPPGAHRIELALSVPAYRGMLVADAIVMLIVIALLVVRPKFVD